MQENVLEIKNVSKHFAGVKALDDVSFNIKKGSCHCLVGENGAGKSTLIKIITGAHKRTAGTILYNGKEYNPSSTKDAMKTGIGCLFQELNVVEQLRVEENICLGLEETKYGIIQNNNESLKKVLDVLATLDASINPKSYVEELSVAKRQVIEIAKALALDSDIIIMDEPTAALSEEEVRRLFQVVADLKARGVTIIYISHRLDEIFEIGDYITCLRDGRHIETKPRADIHTRQELIQMMIGKVLVEDYIPNKVDYNVKAIEAIGLTNDKKLKNVSFDLHKGEILGFYGLIGAGKTEIANVLYGVDEYEGTVKINGATANIKNPTQAIAKGLALVPEERRTEGLCTMLSICDNTPMMNYKTVSSGGILNAKKMKDLADMYVKKVVVACRDSAQVIAFLSGGNQQKVVLSKCLNSNPDIILLDEPTRGVDVGAKQEIYALIRELSEQGRSVIVFSSELPEILNICDRVGLLYDGSLQEIIQNGDDVDSQHIMNIVTGGV
ncbi:sugar ABC transporter ATP-binding protein [Chakrabartyella piscis]|uniref:sugar ABC transporter ATP-binding protein n=1 Tax=Chakrabartyella piscis TaxID=2918914 RepID=UPI002958AF07|nr:sugar ABC transporter ATP-binding protein [Chakrabartyella piscis]